MKKKITFLVLLFLLLKVAVLSAANTPDLTSPDGKIQVFLKLDKESILRYSVFYQSKEVLKPSSIGIKRSDADFTHNLKINKRSEIVVVDDKFETPSEKIWHNSYKANRRIFYVKNEKGQSLSITFQISNDGLAFRYAFEEQSTDVKTILSENTSFAFPETAKAWLHPHANVKEGWCKTSPSYEEYYKMDIPVGTSAPLAAGWSFPALFQSNGVWVLLTEGGLEPPYCGTRLAQLSPNGEYKIAFPQKGETTGANDPIEPTGKLPIFSPWRIVMLGSLASIVESNLVPALASPSKLKDLDFIKPGIASWSWGVEHDESMNYNEQRRFIDYAAQMGWPYCLFDADWDRILGYERMKELVDYAKTRNVKIILWYNSSGDWNTTVYSPKSVLNEKAKRRAEFERVSKMGVVGLKVDFWPGDGPSAIQYYYDLLADAADFKLMINCHGATVPRGWSRTFPNLVTMEAVRGFEFLTFEQANTDNQPTHCAMLPFARNVVGPMDFTPVCFGEIPGKIRRTSNAFELALTVVFQSGVSHYVEVPESMMRQPEYVIDYMKTVPGHWQNLKFMDGFPGKFAVIAREANGKWYIGGINSEDSDRELSLDVSSLSKSNQCHLITDGKSNREFSESKIEIKNGKLSLMLKAKGGFVLEL